MKSAKNGQQPYLRCRGRVLERLERGAVWTIELRKSPEKYSANPAQGVAELRDSGKDIRTVRAWTYDREGLPDEGRDFYVLVRGSKLREYGWGDWRWEGGKPVMGKMLSPVWRRAILKAWEAQP